MIFISKSGYLKYKNLTFKCALGKAGIGNKKKEGDNITPKGTYKIIKIYYRKDRIKKLISQIRPIQIKKSMGWCDDPKCKNYNRLIILPSQFSHEKLFRKDNIYDLILVLNYNIKPIKKNKGSAIFIHVARKKYKKTAGCVALKKVHLIYLVKEIKKNTKVFIN
jgi:L,D-peptidoglycan transpeptidase YkuD (ErfK/YbiS/YcfS/YnhG family)